MKGTIRIKGQIVDIHNQRIYPGCVTIRDGLITKIEETNSAPEQFVMPGFIDAHIHIESSMLVPSEFARIAVRHGTVATVSDPHEIANVLGVEGVHYMISNGEKVNFKFNFGAPSCVPATTFETAGDCIDADQIRALLSDERIRYLSEMMNWPGVLARDEEVVRKIKAAQDAGKPVDGHAPGLKGKQAATYAGAGISTDHECFKMEEALDKLKCGMKIIIREGSAARNFEELYPLIDQYPERIMLCSDDKHPDDLLHGHINRLAARAIRQKCSLFNVLKAACINPVRHYNLPVGTLKPGDPADCIIVNNLEQFDVIATYINGACVFDGNCLIDSVPFSTPNRFNIEPVNASEIIIDHPERKVRVITAEDRQLITGEMMVDLPNYNGKLEPDIQNDILKIVVVNRYEQATPAVALVHGFGLKEGAIASSVAHDSHNIVATGTSDDWIEKAVNAVIEAKGGISAAGPGVSKVLPLPVAGLMSADDGETVARAYEEIDDIAKNLGTVLEAPFMTLSFMALLVIPSLKLSDRGLFDGTRFRFVELGK